MKPAAELDLKFPPAWSWFVDEAIPAYVKGQYSPDERWKGKPFAEPDAAFFFRGIAELSELFTDERPRTLPAYFRHPKFRSAYLLYFLPLQAAKFVSLFRLHEPALELMLQHGLKTGTLRVADLGAGPGTASLALVLWLLERASAENIELPMLEFHWWDTDRLIQQDGKHLLQQLAEYFPRLRGKVRVETYVDPWWRAARALRQETSLVLMGHVLNEKGGRPNPPPAQLAPAPEVEDESILLDAESSDDEDFDDEESPTPSRKSRPKGQAPRDPAAEALGLILSRAAGGGMLCVEPAARIPSQQLSRIRDQLLEQGALAPHASAIWGPCAHAGACPLSDGRDWCHFSLPLHVPGKWFKEFSKRLSSERHWLKFSYLWLAAPATRAPILKAHQRLVVSEPLRRPGESLPFVLTCEPEQPGRVWITEPDVRVHRGDVIGLDDPAFADSPHASRARASIQEKGVLKARQDYQDRARKKKAGAGDEAKPKRLGKRQRDRLKKRT